MPDVWKKREFVEDWIAEFFPDIWDHHLGWWQINRSAKDTGYNGSYILLDALQPHGVPASSVHGCFPTLEEAQEAADQEGKPDWSDWIKEYGE